MNWPIPLLPIALPFHDQAGHVSCLPSHTRGPEAPAIVRAAPPHDLKHRHKTPQKAIWSSTPPFTRKPQHQVTHGGDEVQIRLRNQVFLSRALIGSDNAYDAHSLAAHQVDTNPISLEQSRSSPMMQRDWSLPPYLRPWSNN
jgi:hypothetical protein